ncbi:carbohydrate ABC transporter permease [Paenibacillus filicis]|uniref:Carbohydrate ABC transporter permease n=1 Tax=Paenibacillus gyeongsangnamensis TaxID=3388067 RepID=A0ABT4Q3Z7_9BACL|nr:carbohydrate ABC transporter permease [Paenibacillus filicis]MCZ8511584.1 carbohydrate ABC transporter permease [Paenibacillus filicis]
MRTSVNHGKAFLNLFLAVSAIVVLVPLYWMVSTSLKTSAEVAKVPPTLFPSHFRWANYLDVITQAPLLGYLANTIIVGVSVVAVGTAVTVLSAFAFARLHFRGKNLLFFAILSTMMIPQEMLIITNFQTIAQWGWMNTLQALIIPYWINPFNIYLLRQTFLQIPDELYLAAKVDGLGNFRYLSKVLVPMSWSTILTTMILSLILIWHTFAWPDLVTTKDSLRLVSNGLQNAFTSSVGNIDYELQMAAATLITVPLIVLFLLLRNFIFSGLMHGGIKG